MIEEVIGLGVESKATLRSMKTTTTPQERYVFL
jgi:hypothetical protein